MFFRNIIFFNLCVGLCLLLSGCDAVYRLLDKQGAQEKELIGEIIPFEQNEVVEEVQVLLHLYGYNVGKSDGILGLRTRNAIEKFQKDNGLDPSRFIDNETWGKLHVFTENLLVVDHKLNMKLIQALLEVAGFNPGGVDGKMGNKTRSAIKNFQNNLIIKKKIS